MDCYTCKHFEYWLDLGSLSFDCKKHAMALRKLPIMLVACSWYERTEPKEDCEE